MRPFRYERAAHVADAVHAAASSGNEPPTQSSAQFIAGGTTILDLMKLDVMRPEALIDILDSEPAHARIEQRADGIALGAFVRMAEAADHPEIRRNYPVIAQA